MGYVIVAIVYLVIALTLLQVGYYAAALTAPLFMLVGFGVVMLEFTRALGRNMSAGLEGLGLEPPAAGEPGEPAYRNYFLGPVVRDYARVVGEGTTTTVARLFGGPAVVQDPFAPEPAPVRRPIVRMIFGLLNRFHSTMWKALVALPVLFGIAALLAGAAVGGLAVLAVVLVFGLLVVLIDVSAVVVAGSVRAFESVSLSARGITIECAHCHNRVLRPVYECHSCGAQHKRLLPGSLGVFRRVCRCGESLPTLLVGGKLALHSRCSHCDDRLPIKGLSAPTFHIPVVAGPSAGKTAFMITSVARLFDRAAGVPEDELEFADQRAKDRFIAASTAVHSGDPTLILKTRAADSIHAFNVYLGREKSPGRTLMYLYDPAGEALQGVEGLANWHFLPHSRGLVLVVDPFGLPSVRKLASARVLADLRPSPEQPEAILGRLTEALREREGDGRAVRAVRVAVVVTKSDGLLQLNGIGHPYDGLSERAGRTGPAGPAGPTDGDRRQLRSAAVSSWLENEVDQRNFVASLANTFRTVSYFAVTALDGAGPEDRRSARSSRPVRSDDPCDPLLWLVKGRTS
jgi:hypothetical protein